jgi:hypothetical protein
VRFVTAFSCVEVLIDKSGSRIEVLLHVLFLKGRWPSGLVDIESVSLFGQARNKTIVCIPRVFGCTSNGFTLPRSTMFH